MQIGIQTMCSRNEDSDQTIAERFKKDYTEQFYILVRMHLSFLLDINTDENESIPEKGRIKKWNLVPFAKKSKLRSVTEGAPLTQEGISQIFHLIEFLKTEENIKSEGIFRRTGSIERQQELRNFLNQSSTFDLSSGNYSVHDCASVLKGFLQDLTDPLLTEVHFPVYCQIAELYDVNVPTTQESKLLEALQLLLLLLPSENMLLLKELLGLLHYTTTFESNNRMSPDNLAKLFTPHLLCPRNLTPTLLLKVSQTLFSIVSFMIKKYNELFKIPAKLIVDFRAKYEKKRVLSPVKRLNESQADVASTVFTFVDQERTAKENESNPTETALAQLYAHIQSLPESSKKRKLVKQFNKENGHGTPMQAAKNSKNRSIGDSIKKHIFQKHLARKKGFVLKSSCDKFESPTGSPSLVTRARLFCHHNCESFSDQSHEGQCPVPNKRRKASRSCERSGAQKEPDECQGKASLSEPEFSDSGESRKCNLYLTSTPACRPLKACDDVFTPDNHNRKSMSPITMSAQRMSRAMQETMMTPRSRKPVLLLSGTNINTLHKTEQPSCTMDNVIEEKDTPSTSYQPNLPFKSKSEGDINKNKTDIAKINKSDSDVILTETFKEYLSNREILTCFSPQDSSFSSRTDDFNSTDLENFTDGQFSDSLIYCLNGNDPEDMNVIEEQEEKKLVLKPKQFDENGKAIIFETSF